MRYPDDTPPWLHEIVDDLVNDAIRSMSNDEPAKAVGFFSAVQKLKDGIAAQAEAVEAKRKKELRDLTFPQSN